MSYNVARRRGEIGIRMALGAGRSKVVRMVLGESVLMVAIGLGIGAGVALAATRLIRSFLFDMKPTDPATLAGAFVILALGGVFAGYLPARRAARMDPMVALREE
jgi:ABC-type antimicrobial peptide transport system permease subunit